MTELFRNTNRYGRILLRDNYEDALAESEELYDKECERCKCLTPKEERATKYLLAVKEHVLSGQVGLYIPPDPIEIPSKHLTGIYIDNPLWVNYDFIHGDPFMALGVGGFPFLNLVNPSENRKILEGNFSRKLIYQVRHSSRKYTIQVHNRCSQLINSLLNQTNIKEQLLQRIDSDLFEELVADLLREQGLDVFLTNRTADGGKDIWATAVKNGRPVTALVECKVRDSKRAIDPALARAVVGTFFIERARGINVDCAVMVTTSDNIGPETLAIQEEIREFSIKDCNDVVSWISRYGAIRNGLWVPDFLSEFLF